MDEIDFNVDNYDIDELVQLLNFDTVPTNEDMIVQRIDVLKRRYKDKPKYITFFNKVGKKLIVNFETFNKETWQESYENDETLAAKVLTQQYLDNKNDRKNLMLDDNRDIIGIKKVSETNRYATKTTTQGVRNPVTINTIRRIVNFDSQYREILNPISTTCSDTNGNYTNNPSNINNVNHVNPEIRLFQPTNYTVNLNQPLTNVVDISLESVEIPNSWYVFSSDYGTNAIDFTYVKREIRDTDADILLPSIPSGFSLIIEIFATNSSQGVIDPQIGITKSVKTEDIVWLSGLNDDDSGPGLLSKMKFSSTDLLTNTLYDLWVGEYKLTFTNGQIPVNTHRNEVGREWKLRFKIVDTATETIPLDDFTEIIIDGTIPSEGVSLVRTFIIKYVDPTPTSVNYNTLKLEIENGNYQPDELMKSINDLCILNYIPVEFSYSTVSGKVTITNLDVKNNITIRFYIEDAESSGCSAQKTLNEEGSNTPSPGNKIGYNLGWLLGFRVKTLILSPAQKTTATSLLDTFGPKYFLLTLDDFNNNKPNKDLISLVDNSAKNFKLPNYYNPQTMDSRYGVKRDASGNQIGNTYYPGHSATDLDADAWKCQDIAGLPAERGCAENDLNNDLISNLTKKQQYTVEQLTLANTSGGSVLLDDGTSLSTVVNRYNSPNSSDLLARIPIPIKRQEYNTSIVFRNRHPEYTKRVYFGPVKLRKFKIRLLNDKGFEVNLNEQDWSFSIYVTQLYQF